jgi:hypothetical protein
MHSEHPQEELKKNFWEEQLKRITLKEPPMKSKWSWIKPLSGYHTLEFRGKIKIHHIRT